MSNLGDSSVEFGVYYRVEKYSDSFKVNSEMKKEVLKQLKKHNIHIPFPSREVYLSEVAK
jgi:small-conductance mechanosensitive channel